RDGRCVTRRIETRHLERLVFEAERAAVAAQRLSHGALAAGAEVEELLSGLPERARIVDQPEEREDPLLRARPGGPQPERPIPRQGGSALFQGVEIERVLDHVPRVRLAAVPCIQGALAVSLALQVGPVVAVAVLQDLKGHHLPLRDAADVDLHRLIDSLNGIRVDLDPGRWPWIRCRRRGEQEGGGAEDQKRARHGASPSKCLLKNFSSDVFLQKCFLETMAVHGLWRQSLAEAAPADRFDIFRGLETGATGAAASPQQQYSAFSRAL